MPKPSTLALRKLNVKRKVNLRGVVHYADRTPEGTIIDPAEESVRRACPFTLERWIEHTNVWESVENFGTLDRAIKRTHLAKEDPLYRGYTLRIRDRRDGSFIMGNIL